MQLTDALIKNAKPGDQPIYVWDDSLKNFGFRVTKTGVKTFVVLIGGGRRQSIGRYPLISLAEARTTAKRILAEKTLGRVRPLHVAHDDAVERFLDECRHKNRPKTVIDYARLLHRHFAFGRKPVGDITARIVLRQLEKLRLTPAERRYAFVVGRAFYKWCVSEHIIDRSPMEDLRVPPTNPSRDRVLSDDELQAVYTVVKANRSVYHHIVNFLILTGQRKNEIASLRWEYIDHEKKLITLPATGTKNRRAHTFPFNELPFPLHSSGYLFPSRVGSGFFNGWSKAKRQLDEECGVQDWTLHDLRRTFSSNMAALGIQQVVVEKLLNHVSGGTQSPIAQVYNRHQYLDEMRQAVIVWENKLANLIPPTG